MGLFRKKPVGVDYGELERLALRKDLVLVPRLREAEYEHRPHIVYSIQNDGTAVLISMHGQCIEGMVKDSFSWNRAEATANWATLGIKARLKDLYVTYCGVQSCKNGGRAYMEFSQADSVGSQVNSIETLKSIIGLMKDVERRIIEKYEADKEQIRKIMKEK